jgi:HAD superfamily hydrolase (TIGR01493 family)
VTTLVFDVLGTVVDEAGSILAAVEATLTAAGAGTGRADQLAAAWSDRLDALSSQVISGPAAWRGNDELRRAALGEAVRAAGLDPLSGPIRATTLQSDAVQSDAVQPGAVQPGAVQPGAVQPGAGQPTMAQSGAGLVAAGDGGRAARSPRERPGLDDAALDQLALAAGRRLTPWPDSAAALTRLARSFTVVALSNGDLAQLADMFSAGGLTWHCVLSAELARSYKPDPAVYRLVTERLRRPLNEVMMVAAHPWDLRAAAACGMRTAYVNRPGEGIPAPDDRFDLRADSLDDLARQLAPA